MFTKADWIWLSEEAPDTYADFICDFVSDGGKTLIRIAADSNYAAYINGTLALFGQYADYPHYKIADTVDITEFIKPGKNHLAVIVWYYGGNSSTYCPGKAGLIFEVEEAGRIIAASGENILSRPDPGYIHGKCDMISPQLGFTFRRDNINADDSFITGASEGFSKSRIVDITKNAHPRPNKKLILGERLPVKLSRTGTFRYSDGWEKHNASRNMHFAATSFCFTRDITDKPNNHKIISEDSVSFDSKRVSTDGDNIFVILDLGHESVGFLDIDIEVPKSCRIDIGWGEHLDDGVCRTSIRGFFTEFEAKAGRNSYMNPFRRMGCRYIQLFIHSSEAIIHYVGIRPVSYPLTRKEYRSGNLLRDTIYSVCCDTLEYCMHEHYEDCPWREQALYTLDSRNQMLCGYYAFNETEFPRSALSLIAEGLSDKGLLSICYPCSIDLYIPSFSTVYFIQMEEYIRHSGDTTLAAEVYDTLEALMSTFTSRIDETGLVRSFTEDKAFWNFYEWQPTLHELKLSADDIIYQAPLCAMTSLALDSFARICTSLKKNTRAAELLEVRDRLNAAIKAHFWDADRKLFITSVRDVPISVLSNALCVLCGAADELDLSEILRILSVNGKNPDGTDMTGIIPNTLSMNSFRFDALLSIDRDKYKDIILAEIERDYFYMLRNGATAFWETIKGEEDFNEAGSLCHGWSALPIYYLEILSD